jgi:hypothetical protein
MRTLFGFLLAFLLLLPQGADAARRDERTTQATRTSAPASAAKAAATRTAHAAPRRASAARTTASRSTASRTTRTAASRTTRAAASRTTRTARPTAARTTRATASRTTRAARPTAARTTRAAASRTTRRAPTRIAARSNSRPGDVRSQRQGIVVRGASAAAIPRIAQPASARRCTRRNGRTVCTTQRRVARNPVAGWHRGLSSASMTQRDCPAGTFATLARGHDDIVRCMPL